MEGCLEQMQSFNLDYAVNGSGEDDAYIESYVNASYKNSGM